ncbi:MAG: hypothetical protein JXR07_02735 [Reichenbachiella sp.]
MNIAIGLILILSLATALYAQFKSSSIRKREEETELFKLKKDSNKFYSYIAQIAYVDQLIEEFPEYKQEYINEKIMPVLTVLKQFKDFTELPKDTQPLLKKYWEI